MQIAEICCGGYSEGEVSRPELKELDDAKAICAAIKNDLVNKGIDQLKCVALCIMLGQQSRVGQVGSVSPFSGQTS